MLSRRTFFKLIPPGLAAALGLVALPEPEPEPEHGDWVTLMKTWSGDGSVIAWWPLWETEGKVVHNMVNAEHNGVHSMADRFESDKGMMMGGTFFTWDELDKLARVSGE